MTLEKFTERKSAATGKSYPDCFKSAGLELAYRTTEIDY